MSEGWGVVKGGKALGRTYMFRVFREHGLGSVAFQHTAVDGSLTSGQLSVGYDWTGCCPYS